MTQKIELDLRGCGKGKKFYDNLEFLTKVLWNTYSGDFELTAIISTNQEKDILSSGAVARDLVVDVISLKGLKEYRTAYTSIKIKVEDIDGVLNNNTHIRPRR